MGKIMVKKVDAFTQIPFGGNPAGVVTGASGLSEYQMQNIAQEMNLSETAFVLPAEDARADFRVRFFTPRAEVDLCGHATIGAFFALAEEGLVELVGDRVVVKQETRAGVLPVEYRLAQGRLQSIMMDQAPPRFQPVENSREEVAALLGIGAGEVIGTDLPMELAFTGNWHLIVPVAHREAIDNAIPDLGGLGELNRSQGAVTTHLFTLETVAADSNVYTRDFAPAVGVAEDPVTGTANGALGAYLVRHGVVSQKEPVVAIRAEQGHAIGRPGLVAVEVTVEAGRPVAVKVGGLAVTVMTGEMLIP